MVRTSAYLLAGLSAATYVFGTWFTATYYVDGGHVPWTQPIPWSSQLALLGSVGRAELVRVLPLSGAVFIALLLGAVVAVLRWASRLRVVGAASLFLAVVLAFLVLDTHGPLAAVSVLFLLFGPLDGEWLGEHWALLHAQGFLIYSAGAALWTSVSEWRAMEGAS